MTPRTALVTGASRGIGRAIAHHLAQAGWRVGIHFNVNTEAAEVTRAGMMGDGHALFAADLSDPDAVERLACEALDAFAGRVDALVHNAGVYEATPLLDTLTLAEWRANLRRQMQVNFWAGADLAYLLAPAMAQSGWGRIVQISSRAGIRGEPRHAGYGASKAAQINLVKSFAAELGPHGVACFGIAPGWTETDMASEALAVRGDQMRAAIPVGRVAVPDDIAALVAFLCTPAADYLSGNTIDVGGASYLH